MKQEIAIPPINTDSYYLKYDTRMSAGVLLLLNSPKFMEFGIDYSAWTIGEKFMGIKLIPPGPHFIYYSTKEEDYTYKQGFFISVSTKKVHVRKWSVEIGEFVNLSEEEEKNFTIGVQNLDFDAYLGNYPFEKIDDWRDLTSFIDDKLLERLEPISKKYITCEKEYEDMSNTTTNFKGSIYFTSIPKNKFLLNFKKKTLNENQDDIDINPNIIQPETTQSLNSGILTKINLDKSSILETLIFKEYSNNANLLIGEFQYSFITFFLCEIYDSLEQWKHFLILLLSCEEALISRQTFFCDLIEVLYHQCRQLPKDFFMDEITKDNFLNRLLNTFFDNCKTLPLKSQLNRRVKLFKKFLLEFFQFKVRDEEERIIDKYLNQNEYLNNDFDDDLPVIVEDKEIESILNFRNEDAERNNPSLVNPSDIMEIEENVMRDFTTEENTSENNTLNSSPYYDILMN